MFHETVLFQLQSRVEWGWYWLVTENMWEVASSSAIMKSHIISPINKLWCWSAFRLSTFLDRRMFRNRNACWLTRLVSTFSAFCVPSNRTISSSSPDKAMGGPLRRIVWGEVNVWWRLLRCICLTSKVFSSPVYAPTPLVIWRLSFQYLGCIALNLLFACRCWRKPRNSNEESLEHTPGALSLDQSVRC